MYVPFAAVSLGWAMTKPILVLCNVLEKFVTRPAFSKTLALDGALHLVELRLSRKEVAMLFNKMSLARLCPCIGAFAPPFCVHTVLDWAEHICPDVIPFRFRGSSRGTLSCSWGRVSSSRVRVGRVILVIVI